MKKLFIGIGILALIVAIAGIYKFDYLSQKDGYDVDGNKIHKSSTDK